jgi:hypothetical protein
MSRENKSKMPNGFYVYGDTLFAVMYSGEQAIRMTDGKLFKPAPEGMRIAQIWADYTPQGTKELRPGYGIAWDINDGADWCVVGSLA